MAKVGDKEASRNAYQESLVSDSTLTQYTNLSRRQALTLHAI